MMMKKFDIQEVLHLNIEKTSWEKIGSKKILVPKIGDVVVSYDDDGDPMYNLPVEQQDLGLGKESPDMNIKTIYFDKEAIVPRNLFRIYAKKHGIKIVTDENKADLTVIGKDSLTKMLEKDYSSFIRKDVLLEHVKKSNIKRKKELIKEISEAGDVVILEDCPTAFLEETYKKDVSGYSDDEEYGFKDEYLYFVTNNDFENFTRKNLCGDSCIVELLGSDVPIEYERLRDMFNSENKSDQRVALQLMLNCNFKKNLLHLLLLMQEYWDKIYWVDPKRTVWLKSFLNYVNINTYGDSLDLDNNRIIQCLIDKGRFTESSAEFMLKKLKEDAKHSHDDDYSFVNDVCYTPEIAGRIIKEPVYDEDRICL